MAVAGATQAAVKTAEIAFYRTCLKSAISNGCGLEPFMQPLKSRGATG